MAAIGADPEALLELSRSFRRLRGQLEESRARLDRHLRSAGWQGQDAERFRRTWSLHHRGELLRTAELCRDSANRLVRQAEEQVDASARSGAGNPGRRMPSSGGGDPRSVRSILELSAGTQTTVASALLGLDHDIRIENLDGGLSRVTFTSIDRAGIQASFGAAIHVVTQRALGASTSAEASIGGVGRRTYVVDSDQVGELIAVVELRDAATRVARSSALLPAGGAIGTASAIGGWLTGLIPAPAKRLAASLIPDRLRPVPTATESLVQLKVSADAALASVPIIGPSASVGAEYLLRAGRSSGPDGRASVLEVEGAIAAELTTRLFAEAGYASGNQNSSTSQPTLRILIPDPSAGSSAIPGGVMVITSTVTDDNSIRRSVSHVNLSKLGSEPGPVTAARLAFESLAAGNPAEALARVSGMQIPANAITTSSSTFATDHHSATFGAELGEVASIGVDVKGGFSRFTRTG